MTGKYAIGTIHSSNGGEYEVIDIVGATRHIRFVDTGFVKEVGMSAMSQGRIRDPMRPTVEGIGVVGTEERGVSSTKEYKLWARMLYRVCKCEEYRDAHISQSWLVFTNFRQDLPNLLNYDLWSDNQYLYQLDKDTLSPEQKIYSKDTCIFLHKSQNSKEVHGSTNKKWVGVNVRTGDSEVFSDVAGFAKENKLNKTSIYKAAVSNSKVLVGDWAFFIKLEELAK